VHYFDLNIIIIYADFRLFSNAMRRKDFTVKFLLPNLYRYVTCHDTRGMKTLLDNKKEYQDHNLNQIPLSAMYFDNL